MKDGALALSSVPARWSGAARLPSTTCRLAPRSPTSEPSTCPTARFAPSCSRSRIIQLSTKVTSTRGFNFFLEIFLEHEWRVAQRHRTSKTLTPQETLATKLCQTASKHPVMLPLDAAQRLVRVPGVAQSPTAYYSGSGSEAIPPCSRREALRASRPRSEGLVSTLSPQQRIRQHGIP